MFFFCFVLFLPHFFSPNQPLPPQIFCCTLQGSVIYYIPPTSQLLTLESLFDREVCCRPAENQIFPPQTPFRPQNPLPSTPPKIPHPQTGSASEARSDKNSPAPPRPFYGKKHSGSGILAGMGSGLLQNNNHPPAAGGGGGFRPKRPACAPQPLRPWFLHTTNQNEETRKTSLFPPKKIPFILSPPFHIPTPSPLPGTAANPIPHAPSHRTGPN